MTDQTSPAHSAFPGPLLAGIAMVAGPLLLVAGALTGWGLLIDDEATGMADRKDAIGRAQMAANLIVAGLALSMFIVLALGNMIARARPGFARWGVGMALIALFVQGYFWGIDHIALGLADSQESAAAATILEQASEGFTIVMFAAPLIVFSWFVLAYGAYRADVLGLPRALALAATGLLPLGPIGGIEVAVPLVWGALAVAVVPLGVQILQARRGGSAQPYGVATAP